MLVHPGIDGGIPLDSSVECQEFRFHRWNAERQGAVNLKPFTESIHRPGTGHHGERLAARVSHRRTGSGGFGPQTQAQRVDQLVPFIRRSSTAQHSVWTLVLAGMLVLPFLRPVVPATHIRLPQVLTPRLKHALGVTTSDSSVAPPSMPPPENRTPAFPLWPLFVMAAYLAGVALFGARLLGGVLLTRRALGNTRAIPSELWEYYDLIANANVDLSLEESDYVRVPLTTGSDLMRVILPADWRAWPAEKRTAVLETTVISGHSLLTNAAMDAAEQYVYKPTLLNDQPVQVLTYVEIIFQLT